jgi:dienelactone hydrolase
MIGCSRKQRKRNRNIFYFFPDDHMWSQAVLRILFTGGAPGEVLHTVARLQPAAGTEHRHEAWQSAWTDVAERLWQQATIERDAGHDATAASAFLRSCTYSQFAIAFSDPTDGVRQSTYLRSLDAFTEYARLSEPPIERVEVPYESGSFPAWFVPAGNGDRPAPAAFYLPGWDSTKEQGIELARRVALQGVSVLLCDGPGIGEAVAFRGLVNRPDYEVPGAAAFDYLAGRDDVDRGRIAVIGSSLGGYRAARVAGGLGDRLAASVVWGAIWDFGAMWRRSLEQPGTTLPTRTAHALHVMGASDLEEVTRLTSAWTLSEVASQITSPLLILHGDEDLQVPTSDAHRLYDVARSPMKELKIFTESALGGAAHCQNDNRLLAHDYIADWLYDVLCQGRRRSGVITDDGRER